MSQIVPWLAEPPDTLHRQAAESLVALWTHDAELGDGAARMAWIVDGLTDDEAETLASLGGLASSEPALTRHLLRLPWVLEMPVNAERNVEWVLLKLLLAIGFEDPELGLLLAMHPLLADDATHDELEVMELLAEAGSSDLELAGRLAAADWVSDGVEGHELRLLSTVVSTADPPTATTEFLLRVPSLADHLTGDLRPHLTRALTNLALDNRESLEQVITQPWFTDGVEEEEAVLTIVLERAALDSPALFRDLITAHHIKTREVKLPLTGNVRLWVVQNSPVHDEADLLQTMEDAVRYLEELVREPFPTNDLILVVVDPGEGSYGIGGEWLNTHMRLIRDPISGEVEEIPHEAGHFIFKGPRWYSEGASELGRAYMNHRTGVQTLDQRREQLGTDATCAHYANIRHWTHQTDELGLPPGDLCPYILGENFLLNTWGLLGQENMSAALGDLHAMGRDRVMPITEEAIYNVLLANAPADMQAAFRDLYRRLHGGPFALRDTDFDDDHGDEAETASVAVVGRSISGELDYLFDFDNFRFQAQEGQKYRIVVEHPSLPPHWVTLYGPDGVTQKIDRWKSRSATPSGPEVLWTASATGQYHFVVRNFGGLTGTYTLNIEAVEDVLDDHGDTPASATTLALGRTASGAVGDSFDFDHFRFRAEQGQWLRVEVRGGTLEILSVGFYEADGATPALMRQEDIEAILNSSSNFVDFYDLENAAWSRSASFDWIAPRTGEYLLVVSGAHESVGTYTIAVTMPER